MTSELAMKVAECVDYVIENNIDSHLWRGQIDTGEWKIMISKSIKGYITIQIKQRADAEGNPVL
jgi:hypothetical protein